MMNWISGIHLHFRDLSGTKLHLGLSGTIIIYCLLAHICYIVTHSNAQCYVTDYENLLLTSSLLFTFLLGKQPVLLPVIMTEMR